MYQDEVSGERLQDHWSSGLFTVWKSMKIRQNLGDKCFQNFHLGEVNRQVLWSEILFNGDASVEP